MGATYSEAWAAVGRELADTSVQVQEAVLRLAQRTLHGVREFREIGFIRGALDLCMRDVDPDQWTLPNVDDMFETLDADLELLGDAIERERGASKAALDQERTLREAAEARLKTCHCSKPRKRRAGGAPPHAPRSRSASEVPRTRRR